MDAVSPDQQAAGHLVRPVACVQCYGNTLVIKGAVCRRASAEPDGRIPRQLAETLVKRHMEPAAMRRILRPVISRICAARLSIDFLPLTPDKRPFARRHPETVHIFCRKAEIHELAHGIGLQIDPDAKRLQLGNLLDHKAGYTDLLQGQRGGKPADPATGDNDAVIGHETPPPVPDAYSFDPRMTSMTASVASGPMPSAGMAEI